MTGLLGSTVLEVAVGVALLYLLLGLICAAAVEALASVMEIRARVLRDGIGQLLAPDEGKHSLITQFYAHPLIRGMMHQGRMPSYLAARIFSEVLLHMATSGKGPSGITVFDLEGGIRTLPSQSLQVSLDALLGSSGGSIEGAQRAIEAWYDYAMDRVRGQYKRWAQGAIIAVASLATIALNADTLHVARQLWLAPSARNQVVKSLLSVDYPNPDQPIPVVKTNPDDVDGSPGLGHLLGWKDVAQDSASWMPRILGWLMTILAVSIVAPLCFDVLSRLMHLRYSGPAPGKAEPIPDMGPTSGGFTS